MSGQATGGRDRGHCIAHACIAQACFSWSCAQQSRCFDRYAAIWQNAPRFTIPAAAFRAQAPQLASLDTESDVAEWKRPGTVCFITIRLHLGSVLLVSFSVSPFTHALELAVLHARCDCAELCSASVCAPSLIAPVILTPARTAQGLHNCDMDVPNV